VVPGSPAAAPGTFRAAVTTNVPVQPGLEVTLVHPDARLDLDAALALVLDSVFLSTARVQTDNRLVFRDLGSEELVATLAGVVNSGPLPTRFRVAGR
jgi:hypothetical protein